MRYDHITDLIGNTPLLRLDPRGHGLAGVELYAKLESHNPFGSVKDRVAWGMIRDEIDGLAAEGRTLIEASSGNTAKALRVLGGLSGVGLRAVTNRIKVTEVRDLLHLLGTDIVELPGLSECPDPTTPNDVYAVIEQTMAKDPGAYHHPSQYTNEKNVEAHYLGTGREIHDDLAADGITRVDYLIGGLGTTGSTRGAATYLRKHNPELRTVAVVSERSDFIPGIRSETEMWDVGLFQPEFYDRIVTVDSGAAVDATLRLATGFGVLAGPTSGAAYAAALETLGALERSRSDDPIVAVIIVCDRLEPYLSYIKKRRPELFGKPGRHRPTEAELAATPRLSPAELTELDRDARPTIVDTRGAMAYRIGHVPGAINLRDDQLDDMLTHGIPFPRSRPVVFVCPVGEISLRFAALARRVGHDAASLDGGVVAWRDAGQPLESSA
ncbi:pyridoxal-phosphate dependent enzyme [Nocardia puris]|uniref:pyridoxal-phosphate dependent enzyme n=1 Tax=Nocardia puris TaxID=208602 RepID=UPI001894D52B|nr:pyridoxal-phosphate dependent enzyme [Nocardia puris]MBF6210444.1 pyridoxal-phosphate dependent enzyme [Nocardia puris]MBF6367519.1 pyridoxal-phosphate dependent enzyme [Nocardia puris]MBF6457704.1 pyridoxal-phosphate dependent enzyme [Nocardia puris]